MLYNLCMSCREKEVDPYYDTDGLCLDCYYIAEEDKRLKELLNATDSFQEDSLPF